MKPPHDNRHGSRPHGGRPPGNRPPHRGPGGPEHPRHESREPDRPRLGLGGARPVGNQQQNDHARSPRPAEAPRGTLWLYGHHAVAAALANPARRLRRLVLTEEAAAALAHRLPEPWAISPERVERARIDHLLGRDAVHQGIALLADPLAAPTLQHTLDRPGPVVVLDQVSDPRNVGAILRCAAAFGGAGVITQDRNAPEETGALAKAASGALETVPLLRAVNIARTLVALKAANLWVVGLDSSGGAPLSGASLHGRRVALGTRRRGDRAASADARDVR